jgi:hypothetical protein
MLRLDPCLRFGLEKPLNPIMPEAPYHSCSVTWRNGLSLTNAAEALGRSRRQVAYYASGEHEVPRTVLLACKGWEAEQRAAA